MKVGLVQFSPIPRDREGNIKIAEGFTNRYFIIIKKKRKKKKKKKNFNKKIKIFLFKFLFIN